MKIWERGKEESLAQYKAFCWYRDLLPENRSMIAAYSACRGKPMKFGNSRWTVWAVENNWQERVRAWDDYLEQQRLDEFKQRYISQYREMTDRQLKIVRGMQMKLVERLKAMSIKELSAIDTLRELRENVKIERSILGEVTSTAEDGNGEAPQIKIVYVDNWRDEVLTVNGNTSGQQRQIEDNGEGGQAALTSGEAQGRGYPGENGGAVSLSETASGAGARPLE